LVRQTASAFAADAFGNALASKVVQLASAPPKAGSGNTYPSWEEIGDDPFGMPSQAPSNQQEPTAEQINRASNTGNSSASDKAEVAQVSRDKVQSSQGVPPPPANDPNVPIEEVVVTGKRMTFGEQNLYDIFHPEIYLDKNYKKPGARFQLVALEEPNDGYINDYTAGSKLRELGFFSRHPNIALNVGKVEKDSLNISTVSARFGASVGLEENATHEGSQVNAFRHTMWQAMITNKYGANIAAEIGNAHENNPYALSKLSGDGPYTFSTLSEADQTIDLLNNRLGRSIGAGTSFNGDRDIALAVLEKYKTDGLWVATKQESDIYQVSQTKLSSEQYKAARDSILSRNNYGFTSDQWKQWGGRMDEKIKQIQMQQNAINGFGI
jgi:hypothetical protein